MSPRPKHSRKSGTFWVIRDAPVVLDPTLGSFFVNRPFYEELGDVLSTSANLSRKNPAVELSVV